MYLKWEKELKTEINNYLSLIKTFEDKWYGKVEGIIEKATKICKEKCNERLSLLDNAIDFYNAKKSNKKELNFNFEYYKKAQEKMFKNLPQLVDGFTIDEFYREKIRHLEEEIERTNYNIIYHLQNKDQKDIKAFLEDYSKIALTPRASKVYDIAPRLMQALIIMPGFVIHPQTFNKSMWLDNSFSMLCKEKYVELVKNNNTETNEFFFSNAFPYNFRSGLGFASSGHIYIKAIDDEDNKSAQVNYISPNFLKKLLLKLDENKYPSMTDFSISLCNDLNINVNKDLKEFKRLYEETPEQILISDQRYYQEKKIKEMKKQAKLDRDARINQAEKDRIMQIRQAEENRQIEEEREERYQLERARQQIMQDEQNNQYHDEQLRLMKTQSKQQIDAQRAQTIAIYDAQIAQLRKEEFTLHGPNDGKRLMAVKNQIRELENKKRHS